MTDLLLQKAWQTTQLAHARWTRKQTRPRSIFESNKCHLLRNRVGGSNHKGQARRRPCKPRTTRPKRKERERRGASRCFGSYVATPLSGTQYTGASVKPSAPCDKENLLSRLLILGSYAVDK